MFAFLKGLFSEDNGSPSSMRLMTWQLVSCGCFIAVYLAIASQISAESIGLVMAMIGTGVTGKVMQKGREENAPKA